MSNGSRLGLVLAGGGARGAYQVGVLKAIAELTGSQTTPFSVITGVSVGSINAAAIACRADDFRAGVDDLESMWRKLHAGDVYRTNVASVAACSLHWLITLILPIVGIPNPRQLLDIRPLEKLLQRELDFAELRRAVEGGVLQAIAVTASSYRDARAKTFFQGAEDLEEWSRARRDGLRTNIGTDHLLASTALPFVFRTRSIDGEHFGDGGMRLTAPLSPAIRLGADRILVIAVRDEGSETFEKRQPPPQLGEIAGYLLDVLFNDNLNADLERLERINHTISLLSERDRERTSLRHIGAHTIRPSKDVRLITGEHAGELPRTIKLLLRGLRAWGEDWRLASYLLFEPGHCGALIDLGYRDAMRDGEKLREFLEPALAA